MKTDKKKREKYLNLSGIACGRFVLIVGIVTGGIFANNYPNLFTGLACGRTMTFGRRAAKMVCAKR